MNAPIFLFSASAHLTAFPRRLAVGLLLLIAALVTMLPAIAHGQLYTENSQLFGDATSDEALGMTVAASGDTVVGATPISNHFYIFVRSGSGWTLQQKFTNSSPNSASDLALDSDTLVARGVVYARSGGTWTPQHTLPAYEHATAALQGNTLVIGSSFNRVSNRGEVRVYFRTGTVWAQQAGFGPDGPDQGLGGSVAVDGDTLVASTSSPTGAYVYVRSGGTWTQQARLVPPGGSGWGMHVAVEGDTAAVSDPSNDRVHVFTRAGTTWTLAQTLTKPATGGSTFGYKLSLKGGILAAGADTLFYLYARTASGWVLAQSISRPAYRFEGGQALANQGKLLVVGNPADNSGSFHGGIVETFSVPPPAAPGSGWRDLDVGAVGIAGGSTDNGPTVAVRGSGADIWERGDQFHYRTESLTGDGAIIARVDSAGSGHPWSKVGVMFREDVAPSSRNVMALVAAGSPVGMQVRSATADMTSFTDAPWLGAPMWLMLARSGNLFAAYRSNDGDNWTPIGSATVSMPATIHAGMAVSSHDNSAINTGTFSGIEIVRNDLPPPAQPNPPSALTGSLAASTSVRLTWADNSNNETGFAVERSPGTGSGPYSVVASPAANATEYTDSGLANNTTYTYRVRAVNGPVSSDASNTFTITTTSTPDTLSGSQLGAAPVNGAFTQSGDSITLDTAGADIWNESDSGYFVHREVTGNFDLKARVTSLANTHPWAKAGVMVRESLNANSRNLFTMISATAAAGLQVRDTTGALTSFTEGRWVTAPFWVRLVRAGDTFQSFISEDGSTWQLVATRTLALPATLHAGVAASSHTTSTTTHATFTNLQFGN